MCDCNKCEPKAVISQHTLLELNKLGIISEANYIRIKLGSKLLDSKYDDTQFIIITKGWYDRGTNALISMGKRGWYDRS